MDSADLASMLFKIPENQNYMVMFYIKKNNTWYFYQDYLYGDMKMMKKEAEHYSQYYPTKVVQVCRYIPYGKEEPIIMKTVKEYEVQY